MSDTTRGEVIANPPDDLEIQEGDTVLMLTAEASSAGRDAENRPGR